MTSSVPNEFKQYIVTDLPKMVEVPGHKAPAPFWVAPDMFPGVSMRVAGLEVSQIVGNPHAHAHEHDVPEIYLCPSETAGAVKVEIQMNQEKFELESPFALFVPPGTTHCFTVLKCEGPHYVLGMLLGDWQAPQ